MIFSKRTYAAVASAFLFFSSTFSSSTGFAQTSCKNAFYKINKYDQIELVRSHSKRDGLHIYGVLIYGRNTQKALGSATEILGSVSYTIRENNIRVHRVVDRAELEGGNIFATLLDDVLKANPEVEKISMNVGPQHLSVSQMERLVQEPSWTGGNNPFLKVLQNAGLMVERAQMIPLMDQYSLVLVLKPVR